MGGGKCLCWPSGIVQKRTDVAAGQVLTVVEPEAGPTFVEVEMPDTTAVYGSVLRVPVQVGDVTGRDIVSAEVFVAYDGDLLTAISADASGTLLVGNWSVETNIVEGVGTNIDTIKMAMATDEDVLTGAGLLIKGDTVECG